MKDAGLLIYTKYIRTWVYMNRVPNLSTMSRM